MVWKGIININSLEDKCLLDLVKIIKINKDIIHILVEDIKKDEFVQKAIKVVKKKHYIYVVKDKVIYVIFKDKMFKFSKGYPELETARDYGKTQGIPEGEMPFEQLINNPLDYRD